MLFIILLMIFNINAFGGDSFFIYPRLKKNTTRGARFYNDKSFYLKALVKRSKKQEKPILGYELFECSYDSCQDESSLILTTEDSFEYVNLFSDLIKYKNELRKDINKHNLLVIPLIPAFGASTLLGAASFVGGGKLGLFIGMIGATVTGGYLLHNLSAAKEIGKESREIYNKTALAEVFKALNETKEIRDRRLIRVSGSNLEELFIELKRIFI